MMAEVTAEPRNTVVLPEELIIEILSRVEFSNTLQLRCVCKRWKSLVVDPEFGKKHFQNYLTNISVLASKAMELYDAFISQRNINNQEQEDAAEEVDDEDEDDDEDDDDDDEEDEEEEEKLKQLVMQLVAKMDSVLLKLRFIKENMVELDTINSVSEALEDIIKCFRSYMRIYLKLGTSSSS